MSNLTKSVGILGIGSCLPQNVLTNHDLEKMVDTSDEWITKRTGISERRIIDKDTPAYELGLEAAKRALDDAKITAEEIDLVLVATDTPDYLVPSTACIIQGRLGATKAAAFDMNAACTGFVYALTVAQQFVSTGYYKHVLIVAVEGLSRITDWEDRSTCVLFGDGAGAAVIGNVEEGYGILATNIGADGSMGHNITVPCCHISSNDLEKRIHENKRVLWMDGSEIFKFAVRVMEQATIKVLEDANLSLNDVKLLFPHQANTRIIDGALKRLGVEEDRYHNIIHKCGNISAASIPVTLDEAVKLNKISKGDNIVMVGFGGGLTWASAVIRWCK